MVHYILRLSIYFFHGSLQTGLTMAYAFQMGNKHLGKCSKIGGKCSGGGGKMQIQQITLNQIA